MSEHIKQTIEITTRSLEETHALGEKIGKQLQPGTVITLNGDLGAGKTAFAQGLGKGLGVPDDFYITSPTFNIINEYPGRMPFYHMDLYRLSSIYDLEDIGFDDIVTGNGVVAMEWADKLPESYLSIDISIKIESLDENSRHFYINIYRHSKTNLLHISV